MSKIKQVAELPVWLRVLSLLVLSISLISVLLFAVLAYFRLSYPFELEWIEGAYVDEMQWVIDGNPLYNTPSIFFIPLNKTPLFFLLSGALIKCIGIGFVAPRLISILSTFGCFFLLFKIVVRDSKHFIPGIVAAGLYASAFRFAGAWMDIARPDSMFLFLILAAFFVGRKYPNRLGMMASGLLYVLAYYTKQLALPIVLVMAPISLVASRGRTWPQWLCAGMVGLFTFLALDALSDGWFSFYTFDAVTYHERVGDLGLFWRALIPRMWPAMLVGLLYPSLFFARLKISQVMRRESIWQHLGIGVALLLASWSVFVKVWTYDNGFMPACAGLAMLAGLGYGWSLELRQRLTHHAANSLFIGGILVLLLCQFGLLLYNPIEQVPTSEDREAWNQFINRLGTLQGEVFVFNHGFVNHLTGKSTHLHSSPFGDVVGWKYPPRTEDDHWRRDKVRQVFEQAIEQQMFNWVIVDKPETSWLPYYIYVDNLFDDPDVARPVTGASARPESLMVKNPVARGGVFPLTDASFDSLLRRYRKTRNLLP